MTKRLKEEDLQRARKNAQKTCSIAGCNKPFLALGFCATHYSRSRKGLPMDAGLLRGKHKREDVIEDVEWIVGTDNPESIARRLDYNSPHQLYEALRVWGRQDLINRLRCSELDNSYLEGR